MKLVHNDLQKYSINTNRGSEYSYCILETQIFLLISIRRICLRYYVDENLFDDTETETCHFDDIFIIWQTRSCQSDTSDSYEWCKNVITKMINEWTFSRNITDSTTKDVIFIYENVFEVIICKICWYWFRARTLYYYSGLTMSHSFQPMTAKLSLKVALPLAKTLATVSCRSSNTMPWGIEFTRKRYNVSFVSLIRALGPVSI